MSRKQLRESLGHLSLDKIRPCHVTGHLQKLKERGKATRTCNLALVVLRNVLKNAKIDGVIKSLPVDGSASRRAKRIRLVSLIDAAGPAFADFPHDRRTDWDGPLCASGI